MWSVRVDPKTSILVAESDPSVLSDLRGTLKFFQFQNVRFSEDAIEILREDDSIRFSLIIIGSGLSGMSPLKVIAALRARGENAETPIIFLHEAHEDSLPERAATAGATVTMEKPVQADLLKTTLEKIFRARIISKVEEEAQCGKYVQAVARLVKDHSVHRASEKYEDGESAFLDALFELFAGTAKLYHYKGNTNQMEWVLQESEKVFPDFKAQVKQRRSLSKRRTEKGPKENPDDSTDEKVEGITPILVALANQRDSHEFKKMFHELQLHNITVASEGLEVLRMDDSMHFELIFLSTSLTDMSPIKVAAALKVGEHNVDTPMVLIRRTHQDSGIEEAADDLFADEIEAPVQIDRLQAVIEKILGKRLSPKAKQEEESARCLETAFRAVQAITSLKNEGIYLGVESSFLDEIRNLFISMSELYLSKGNKDHHEQTLKVAKRIFPDIQDQAERRLGTFLERGKKYLETGMFNYAKADFEAALTLHGESIEAWFGLGESYLGMENKDRAAAAFKHVVNSSEIPSGPDTLNRLGLLACRYEFYDTAIQAFERLLSMYRMDAKLYYNMALVYVKQSNFSEALPLLSRAITLDDEFTPAKTLHKKVTAWAQETPEVVRNIR